jgi:hypothetical protein
VQLAKVSRLAYCFAEQCAPDLATGAPDRCWMTGADRSQGGSSITPGRRPMPPGLRALVNFVEASGVPKAFCGEVDPGRRQKTRHAESWSGFHLRRNRSSPCEHSFIPASGSP